MEMNNENKSEYYLPSNMAPVFDYNKLPFEDYIALTKNYVSRARLDLDSPDRDFIIEANIPFEFRPAGYNPKEPVENGILLTHGLLSSPFALWDLGKHFQQQNFLVRGLLLPGHGTRPGDLLKASMESWSQAMDYGIKSFRGKVKKLYLLGYSTGGALSLYQAIQHLKLDKFIHGLILFAPPLRLKSKRAFMLPYYRHVNKWISKREEKIYTSYYSLPSNAAFSAYQLSLELQKQLVEPVDNLPIFMVVSDNDETVDTAYAMEVFKKQRNKNNKLIIYSQKIQPTGNPHIEYQSSIYPGEKILAYSHICMQISPDNPYYGRHGKFVDSNYRNMLNNTFDWFKGATLDEGEESEIHRLTYNPDFFNLTGKIDTFIDKVSDNHK